MWCLITQAIVAALLALAGLRVRLPSFVRPLRNGLAGLLTLAALGLLGAALWGLGS